MNIQNLSNHYLVMILEDEISSSNGRFSGGPVNFDFGVGKQTKFDVSFLVETSRSKFSESSFCTPNWKCLSHKRVDFGPERQHTVIGFL